MSTIGAAPRAAVHTARAEASRRNSARSRGPKTPEGKVRAAQNALEHGLRAAKHVVLPDEDAAAFAALEAALLDDLAPVGALQAVLASQIVSAAWRLARADRIEAEILIFRDRGEGDLGLAVTRDGNSARALPTLLRYRGAAHAELLRALRTLRALQAAARAGAQAEPAAAPARRRARDLSQRRNEPEQARALQDLSGRSCEPRHEPPARAVPPAPGAPPSRTTPTAPGRGPRRITAAGDGPDPVSRSHAAPGALAAGPAALPSSTAGTKRTREMAADQSLALGATA
jgi:hypothetical protein